jgi:hypothetical protein
MPRFTKEIVRAGVYEVADEQGNRREESISEDRIRHWAKSHREMRKAGLNIPAPTTHALTAVPTTDRKVGQVIKQTPMGQDSFTNGGFWTEMWNEKRPYTDPETGETTMVETLMGALEAPAEYANKIGTVVKETSIFAPPTFKDGRGKVWTDVVAHAALVIQPIEPGQANFQPADGLAIAMSHYVRPLTMAFPPNGKPAAKKKPKPYSPANGSDNNGLDEEDDDDDFGINPDAEMEEALQVPAGSATMQDAVAELRKCGLEVGDDATPQNFLERIILAARQKALTEGGGEEGPSTNPLITEPEGGKKQPAAIAMSNVNKPALAPEFVALQQQNALLMGLVHQQYQVGASTRIANLVASGRIPKALADTHLTPLLPVVKMAMGADNQPVPNELDRLLAFAEALPAPTRTPVLIPGFGNNIPAELAQALAMSHQMPPNAQAQGNPSAAAPVMTEAESVALADSLVANNFVNFGTF